MIADIVTQSFVIVLHCITMPDCQHLLYYIVLLCLIVDIFCITLYYYA